MDKVEILKHSDLFYNLQGAQLQQVADLAHLRYARLNEIIFEEGSAGRDLFVIISGTVEISHRNYRHEQKDTEPVVLATLSHGQSFGEIAFIDKAVREATVKSLDDETRLLQIDANALMDICETNTALGFILLRNIAKDLAFIIREMDVHMLGEGETAINDALPNP